MGVEGDTCFEDLGDFRTEDTLNDNAARSALVNIPTVGLGLTSANRDVDGAWLPKSTSSDAGEI